MPVCYTYPTVPTVRDLHTAVDYNGQLIIDGLRHINSKIRVLPPLPSEMRELIYRNIILTELPSLPSRLKSIICEYTDIKTLPPLPSGLKRLICRNCPNLRELPPLPSGLVSIWCEGCPNLAVPLYSYERIQDYRDRWTAWREEQSKKRCQDRNAVVKEDLIATFWHPSRVEKMLEQGGWDLVDSY